jgi:hypothetical protein
VILGDEEGIADELRRQAALVNVMGGQLKTNWSLRGASQLAGAGSRVLRVLQANRGNRRKTPEQLKRSYRSLLYRLRISGEWPRPRRRTRFPRSE